MPALIASFSLFRSKRPLPIVVVGGMLMTLILFNHVPLLYSFYGHWKPLNLASTGH